MKIFGIKLKPFFRNTGASYSMRLEKRKPIIDTKAIFAEGVALGRMLARESKEHRHPRRRRG